MLNHSDERPDKAFARLLRDHFLAFKELFFESGKQQDSIAVWLVGMSTGAIAIMISQVGKLNSALYPTLKWSVGFLTGTIVLGLLFRIFHLFLQDRERSDMSFIVSWLSGFMQPSEEPPVELPEDAKAGFIAWLLYKHMGQDIDPDWLTYIENENDVEYWKKRYEDHTETFHLLEEEKRKSIIRIFETFSAVMADLEGQPPLKYEDIKKTDKSMGVKKRRLRNICKYLYTLMCISFAVSVLFVSWGFITTDWKANQDSKTTSQQTISTVNQAQNNQTDKPE